MHVPSRLLCCAGVAVFALAAAAAAGPAPAAQSDGAAAYAADFCRLLAFIGGSPLTPDEQRRVGDRTAADFRSDPSGVAKADEQTRAFLDKIAHDPPDAVADRREAFRLSVELLPDADPGRAIVEAHDPTVVFDRAHKRLVTERTLAELSRAYAWVSKLLDTPGPDAGFIAAERTFLKAQYAALPDARQDALAHVERNYPVTVDLVARADKAKIAAWAERSRPIALGLDPQQRSLKLADMLAETYTAALDDQIVRNSLMLGSAANFNMLYHSGYVSGIYR
jgi:hypothetical protein